MSHRHTASTSRSVTRALVVLAWLGSLIAIVVGATISAGWFFGIDALLAGYIVMKTNMAVALFLSGAGLMLLMPPSMKRARRWAGRICAIIVLLLGVLTLAEHLTGLDLHLDQLLAHEAPGAAATVSPNRMGPLGSSTLALIGAALLMLSRRGGGRCLWQPLALITGLVALLPTVGYVYGARELYGVARLTGIAWPTALSLLTLSVGLLCARPREGMMALLISTGPGGMLVRRLLLPSLLLPLLIGWLRVLGEHRGLFDSALGTALVMLLIIVAFTTLVWRGGIRLNEASAVVNRQKELLAVTLASIGDAVIVTDLQGRITFLNGEAERLTGWKHEDASGEPLQSVFRIVHDDSRRAVENPADTVLRLGKTVGLADNILLIARDGSEIPIDDSAAAVKEADGYIHGVVLVFRDSSEKRRHEKALRESEEQFRTMADAIPQLAWIARADGFIFWYNRRWYDYTGTSPEQVEGWGWQNLHDPKMLPAVQGRWQASIASGEPLDMEFPLRGADGRYRWFLTRVMPLKDSGGRVVRWFGTNTDISEKRAAEDALAAAKVSAEAAKSEAERAGKAKDEFLAVLSHELRTPLTPVLTTVSMLQRDPHLAAGLDDKLDLIRRNIELEARLIDDLLDVTRIARGMVELHKRPVELCQVIQRAVEVCMPDIEARKLHFGIDMGPDAPYLIEADPARLQQVFWNLVKNAVKFTPMGGCVGIRCRRDEHGRQVIAEVNDSGTGISSEALPQLFRPFEQGSHGRKRQFGGLGLGLAISKAMVDLHGGSIAAISEGTGKGSTFTVRLPTIAGDSPLQRLEAVAATQVHCSKLRILLVEDHGDTAEMMRMVLESLGHEVSSAADVAAALTIATERTESRLDLLISDLGLPDGSGLELMRGLRSRGLMLPGIALSGYGQEQDVTASRAAGFAAHLTKPVDVEQVAEAIAAVIGSSRPANYL